MKNFFKSNVVLYFVSFALWFLLEPSFSFAQPGKIHQIINREVWSVSKVLTGDYFVEVNDELIIQPGTKIDCKSYKIVVEGKLTANGINSLNQSITFTSTDVAGWKGIYFNTPELAEMRYCHFTKSNPGPDPTSKYRNMNAGVIFATQTNLIIDHCWFYNNFGGIRTQNFTNANITNCKFQNNQINEDYGGLIYIEGSSKDNIENNVFDLNKVNLDGIISVNYNSECKIYNNTFKNTEFVPLGSSYNGSVIISNFSNFPNIMKITHNKFINNGGIDISVTGTSSNFNNSYSFIFKNTFEADNSSATLSCGVYAYKSTVYVISCEFSKYDQAAVKVENAMAEIQSNIFFQNTSKINDIGSTIHFYYNDFNSVGTTINKVFSNRMYENVGINSGTISILTTNVQQSAIPKFIFNGNRFFDNINPSGNGGAITIKAEYLVNDLEVKYNRFQNNSTGLNGGALFLTKKCKGINISSNYFLSNTSQISGGSLMLSDISNSTSIESNEFYLNQAYLNGGAVSIQNSTQNSSSFTSNSNKFFYNEAKINGGAIYCSKSKIDIDANKLLYNKSKAGGAIFFSELSDNSSVKHSFIFGNTVSESGGGLYCVQKWGSSLTINLEDNVFQSNFYRDYGGAMYFNGIGSDSKLIIKRNMINQNKFSTGSPSPTGGGVYIKNHEVEVINSIIHNNSAATDKGALTIDNGFKGFKLINSDVVFNPIAGGIRIIKTSNPANLYTIKNSIFCGQNTKSIIWGNGSQFLEINNCFIDYLPSLVNGINCINMPNPGFENNASDFHLKSTSGCIDKGLPDNLYNDIEDNSNPGYAYYPSFGLLRNDIGASGGPEVINSNSLYKVTGVKPLIPDFRVTILSDQDRKIRIDNLSVVNDPPVIYHFFFGDGEDMILDDNFNYFDYTFSSYTSKKSFEITLVLENIDNMKYCTKVVNFTPKGSSFEVKNHIESNDVKIIENETEIITIFPVENAEYIDFSNLASLDSLNRYKYRLDTIIWERPVIKVENENVFPGGINKVLNQNENIALEKAQENPNLSNSDISIQILSNPCEEKLMLQIYSDIAQSISLQLLDIMGNNIYYQSHLIDGSLYLEINLSDKLPGIYFLKATGGLNSITKKIILK